MATLGTALKHEVHQKVQEIDSDHSMQAPSEKLCDCCGRNHRKLYAFDGYWIGKVCAEDYLLYCCNSDVASPVWRGYEKKHTKVTQMVCPK